MALGHNAKRVAERILWLANRDEDPLTPMQVLKLVYICHGWMLGIYSRPLLSESVEAWTYGPVVPSVYHRYKKFRSSHINEVPDTEPQGVFSENEEDIIEQVWKGYGKLNGIQLSALTHKLGTPWAIVRQMKGSGAIISNDLIEEHYRRLA